jgi:hypothetical protein
VIDLIWRCFLSAIDELDDWVIDWCPGGAPVVSNDVLRKRSQAIWQAGYLNQMTGPNSDEPGHFEARRLTREQHKRILRRRSRKP